MKHVDEAEEQFKLAIKLNPNIPNSHIFYSILLNFKDLEEDAIEKMKEASRVFREKGYRIPEHFVLAWLYEDLANK